MDCDIIKRAVFYHHDDQDYCSCELEYSPLEKNKTYNLCFYLPNKNFYAQDHAKIRAEVLFDGDKDRGFYFVKDVSLEFNNILEYPSLNLDLDLVDLSGYDSRGAIQKNLLELEHWQLEVLFENTIYNQTFLMLLCSEDKLCCLALVSGHEILKALLEGSFTIEHKPNLYKDVCEASAGYVFRDEEGNLAASGDLRYRYREQLYSLLYNSVIYPKHIKFLIS